MSRIFTDLVMHNYQSNQSAFMTRCGTDLRHQYGIFGGKSQTSFSRNATRPGAKKDGCFRRLPRIHLRDLCNRFQFALDENLGHFEVNLLDHAKIVLQAIL